MNLQTEHNNRNRWFYPAIMILCVSGLLVFRFEYSLILTGLFLIWFRKEAAEETARFNRMLGLSYEENGLQAAIAMNLAGGFIAVLTGILLLLGLLNKPNISNSQPKPNGQHFEDRYAPP